MGLELREQDPRGDRFNAVAQAVLFSLVGCIVGLVAAGLLVGMSHPVGWLITALGASIGAIPMARWQRNRNATGHIDLFDIEPELRPLLLRAATAADRIERAAATAPDGPVAEILDENHRAALGHVKIVEHDARVGGIATKADLLRLCHQLDELAKTSERLLHAALEAQPTVLNALTERTELVRRALGQPELDADAGTIEGSGGHDHVDRDATNDR